MRRCWLILGLLAAPHTARAEACAEAQPWSRLGTSARNFARPVPLTLTALSALAPFGFVPTGWDHDLRLVAQRDLGGKPQLEPVSVATPYVLGGGLLIAYGISAGVGSCRSEHAISPVLQAGFVTYLTVAVLKVGTGRRWPNGGSDPNAPDRLEHLERPKEWDPFQRGIGAWPSGHTAVMFAGAAAFRASNPELGVVAYAGYPVAIAVASGMWLGDHHWASDIVSGALLGEAIGSSVGQSFSESLGVPGTLTIVPMSQTGYGALWFGQW